MQHPGLPWRNTQQIGIDGLAGGLQEFKNLVQCFDHSSTRFGMEISTKTKLMISKPTGDSSQWTEISSIDQPKVPGIYYIRQHNKIDCSQQHGKDNILFWKIEANMKEHEHHTWLQAEPMCSFIISIFLYVCEIWTLTSKMKIRIPKP